MLTDRGIGFMHIPKTSGSALLVALSAALGTNCRHAGFDRSQFGAWDGVSALPHELQSLIWPEAESAFLCDKLVAGHLSYTTLTRASLGLRLMSILREPISRLLSLWLFWRQVDPCHLAAWGTWGDIVRLSHLPLERFLSAEEVACHTDNVVVRMLLWPDDRIPAGSFIDPVNDDYIIKAAFARLDAFEFLGITEDPALEKRLQHWLGRNLVIPRVNETTWMPQGLRSSMETELTSHAFNLLKSLSRLDVRIWEATVQRTMPVRSVDKLRDTTLAQNIERYSVVMAR